MKLYTLRTLGKRENSLVNYQREGNCNNLFFMLQKTFENWENQSNKNEASLIKSREKQKSLAEMEASYTSLEADVFFRMYNRYFIAMEEKIEIHISNAAEV